MVFDTDNLIQGFEDAKEYVKDQPIKGAVIAFIRNDKEVVYTYFGGHATPAELIGSLEIAKLDLLKRIAGSDG